MRHPALLLVFLATVLLATVETKAQQQFVRPIDVGGDSREYLLYLPTGFDPSENMPVMMWFHGGGGTASGALSFEADFRSLANANRFIVVYAAAIPDVPEGCTCWGYDSGDGETNGNYAKDLAYTSAMIDDLVATYNADRTRIYAGGYSMGGSFVWDLACARSEEIAGIAPVAASMYLWTYNGCNAAAPTTVCHILGTQDFYAPYNGASWVPSVANQNAFWVAKNQTESSPETTNLGGGVTRYTWAPGEGCHGLQHFRREGGGHDVPTFAPAAIWDYLSQFNLDGLIECDPVEPPTNDECGDAIELTVGDNAFSTEAASDSGVPSALGCSNSAGPVVRSDVWFRLVAPCTGNFEISTCSADFDTRIDVFNGGCPTGKSSPYACADDGCGDDAVVSSLALQGQILLVRVGSSDGTTGSGTLSVSCTPFEPQNPADFNQDGVVDSADLGYLIASWGTPAADLDGDGTTTSSDLGMLIAAWS